MKIEINDEIGFWGVNHQEFKAKVEGFSGDITLEIASFGGDISHALPIYNMIKSHAGRVTANIYGDAASAATFIALAADEVRMVDNAFFLIHNVWTMAVGDSNDLREAAEEMDKFNNVIKDIYKKETGLSKKEITEMMNEGAWWTAKEAKTNGFVDEVVAPAKILNRKEAVMLNCISEEAKQDLLNKVNSIEMDKNNVEEMSSNIFKSVMAKVKEILPNKEANVLDEDSEAKVIGICNEVAEEIKNDASAEMIELANSLTELEAKYKAEVESKEAIEKELNTLKASEVVVENGSDPVIDGEKKELTPMDKMAESFKNNIIFKYSK